MERTSLRGYDWLLQQSSIPPEEVAKATEATQAWFIQIDGQPLFAKWYPPDRIDSWVCVETAIAGGELRPAIVPLRRQVECCDGVLLLYDRVTGESLGSMNARAAFQAIPVGERSAAVLAVCDALRAVCEAGFTVVDWYEGNMIYDFEGRTIWLFDWELCRSGESFELDMDSNYGSSRLMAPEEFIRGSRIDQATLVFNLGRYSLLTLPELAEPCAEILSRATYPARAGRYATVREFSDALRRQLSMTGLELS